MSLPVIKTALAGVLLFAAGCSSDKDVEPVRRFISFQMNGEVILSEQRNMVYYAPGNITDTDPSNDQAQMLIQGYTDKKDAIYIHILGDADQLKPGTYTSNLPGNAFNMEKFPSMEFLRADETSGNWSVHIHQVKDGLVIGEFAGTAISMDQGTIHPITAGYFKLKYQQRP